MNSEILQSLEQEFNLANKNPEEIVNVLEKKLNEQQKETINQLVALDQEVDDIINQINKLDMKYVEFEGLIEAHTEHIKAISRGTQNMESYLKVLEIRIKNQKQLSEYIK
ncbi:unnamed protein product (macronuclear) [Paramecium tetraurelia]|uniref:Exocyst complex component Sec3 coiled-coil domain-containing protein n=1 Tax=Paramecium tetraurelia TaxID=5888 RepID=A0DLZ8_PARTE|nr:uncharacterized protein GSPATT00018283001 [Paramecium tetraurelia]CAK84065.1 unnamed protein product [Paramecium tetraurelia]|eukprot:XP_001451462.1 hypothetical protein (macronuclear) [Paramecium tetraurelia strain d4-2]